MTFTTQPIEPVEKPKVITLKQEGNNVSIYVDGEDIGFFDSDDNTLSISLSALSYCGLDLYRIGVDNKDE